LPSGGRHDHLVRERRLCAAAPASVRKPASRGEDAIVNSLDLDTPVVIVDLDKVERNLQRWQAYCDSHGIANRPHIKTHKVPEFALEQVRLGARGIACQKLGEAEVMADRDLLDITIPYNLLGQVKLERAVALSRRVRLRVGCDSTTVADGLSEAFADADAPIDVLVECDTGAKRCGVATPKEAAELAAYIAGLPNLTFAGLFTYPASGGTTAVQAFMSAALGELAEKGLEADIVSSGGTPDMWRAHEAPVVTEYRVGTYIYNDRMQVKAGAATFDDCALRVMATVVSHPVPGRFLIDAGSKSLTSDTGGLVGFGRIVEYPDAVIAKLSEEHGHVELPEGAGPGPKIGERVTIIPNHCCPVSNLVDEIAGIRGGRLERYFKVAARGRAR
jgi:D-serine deaminase-like pyridoxal phosphate-dependent protein